MIKGYARVSTKTQAIDGNSLEAQGEQLRANGCEIIYQDAFTGTSKDRPELKQLLEGLEPGDIVICTKLDRIARKVTDGLSIVDEILSKGASINILNMGKIDNSITGKLIKTVMFAFAEMERDLIVQRTAEGRAIARQKPGYREGRPKKFTPQQRDHALELMKSHSIRQTAEMTGISISTLNRIKADARRNETA